MSNIANQRYECYSSGMDLNIREFPDELAKALKMEALDRGVTLRELVIERCSTNVKFGQAETSGVSTTKRSRLSPSRKKNLVPTELPAGSVTTGMEEQGTVAERESQLDADMDAFKERLGQTYHSETCKCLMCQFKRGEIK